MARFISCVEANLGLLSHSEPAAISAKNETGKQDLAPFMCFLLGKSNRAIWVKKEMFLVLKAHSTRICHLFRCFPIPYEDRLSRNKAYLTPLRHYQYDQVHYQKKLYYFLELSCRFSNHIRLGNIILEIYFSWR